jgi:endonuclease/exonuclease/phosphatase family metal-dependent hydrolase
LRLYPALPVPVKKVYGMQPIVRKNGGVPLRLPSGLSLIAAAALICAAVALLIWKPVEPPPVPPADAAAVRFMTYNIRHAEGGDRQVRLAAIREQLEQGGADIIALQEVDRYQWRSGLQDQAYALAKSLRMYYYFAPAFRNGLSEYGIALLSRYPLEQVRKYPLPGESGHEPRTLLTAQVQLSGGSRLTLVTTHLGVTRSERELQMPALLTVLQSIPTPVIVMGDFNMSASDALMNGLTGRLHKIPLDRPQSTVARGGEIDHIFTSFAWTSAAWLQTSQASDHFPVFCEAGLILLSGTTVVN